MSRKMVIIAGALAAYLVALLFQGYGYAVDDQIEILPILKYWISGGQLYTSDFYVQTFASKPLTERTPFLLLLYYTVGVSPQGFVFLHAVTSVLLFTGIILVVDKLTSSPGIGILTSIVLVTFGSYTSLGGNELYYHYLIPSLPAKCLAVWALYLWLSRASLSSMLLLALATYLQPLVGLQVFVVLFTAGLLVHRDKITSLISALLYGVIAGPWIMLLLIEQSAGGGIGNYLEILEFRVAHHFFPSYFSWMHYVVVCVMVLAIFLSHRKHFQSIKAITGVIITIAGIYTVSSILLPLPVIINTQWFKTTIWLELFGIMSIIVWLRDITRADLDRYTYPVIFCILFLLVVIHITGLKDPSYDPPLGKDETAESRVAEWVRNNTPKDAVFILPPRFNSFKSLSGRSSYVDFKAMIHHADYMSEYYSRINEVYDIDVSDRRSHGMSGMLKLAEENMNQRALTLSGKADYLVTRTVLVEANNEPVYDDGGSGGYLVYRLD